MLRARASALSLPDSVAVPLPWFCQGAGLWPARAERMRGLLGVQTAGGARRQALTFGMPPRTSRPCNLEGAAGAHGPRPSGRGSVAVAAAVEWRRLVALALGLSLELDAIGVVDDAVEDRVRDRWLSDPPLASAPRESDWRRGWTCVRGAPPRSPTGRAGPRWRSPAAPSRRGPAGRPCPGDPSGARACPYRGRG